MRILAMFSAAFAAAAALCAYALPAAWGWLPGLCLAALAAALLLLHGDPVRRVRTIALGLAAGFLWCWADAGRLVSVRALCGEGQTIEAEVCSLPERTQYGYRCVTLLQGNRMQLYLRNAPEDAALGDRVRVTADVTETGNSLYLASNDILLLGFARGEAEWEHPAQAPLRYAPQRALLAVQRTITNCFPADTAPLAIALVTGDTSGLPYALQTAMSDAGISHIVAVSGMHVTLLLGVVRLLCLRRRRLTAGVGITVMVFFAAMLGFRPSVTRAVVMNAVLLLAPLLGRENDGPTALCFALLLLLLPNPRAIANVGLQLSFARRGGTAAVFRRLDGLAGGPAACRGPAGAPSAPGAAAARDLCVACGHARCTGLHAAAGGVVFPVDLTGCSADEPAGPAAVQPCVLARVHHGCAGPCVAAARADRSVARGVAAPAGARHRHHGGRASLCCRLSQPDTPVRLAHCRDRNVCDLSAPAAQAARRVCGLPCRDADGSDPRRGPVGDGPRLHDGAGRRAGRLHRSAGRRCDICGGLRRRGRRGCRRNGRARAAHGRRNVRRRPHPDASGCRTHCNGAAQLMARVQVRRLFLPEQESDSREAILTAAERCGTEIVFVTEDLTLDFSGGSRGCLRRSCPARGIAALPH